MGSSCFVSSLLSPNKAVCGVSAGRTKSFLKKLRTVVKDKSQRYIYERYATVSLLLYYGNSMMVYFHSKYK